MNEYAMWKIFISKETNVEKIIQDIHSWKFLVFDFFDKELKKYVANKVITYFDNGMIFQSKKQVYENLVEALSNTEKELQDIHLVYQEIKAYILFEENQTFLITFQLPNKEELYPLDYQFKLLKDDAVPLNGNQEKLEFSSWSTLIFNAELSNFATDWINYIPDLEERAFMQTKYILINKFIQKEMSLLEKIKLEENIQGHHKFQEIYDKIMKILPKIDQQMKNEWKVQQFKENPIKMNVPKTKKMKN